MGLEIREIIGCNENKRHDAKQSSKMRMAVLHCKESMV